MFIPQQSHPVCIRTISSSKNKEILVIQDWEDSMIDTKQIKLVLDNNKRKIENFIGNFTLQKIKSEQNNQKQLQIKVEYKERENKYQGFIQNYDDEKNQQRIEWMYTWDKITSKQSKTLKLFQNNILHDKLDIFINEICVNNIQQTDHQINDMFKVIGISNNELIKQQYYENQKILIQAIKNNFDKQSDNLTLKQNIQNPQYNINIQKDITKTKEKQTDNSNCDIEKQDQKYYQDKISRLQIESQQTKQFLSLSEENIRNLNAEIKILKDQDQELQQLQFNNLCGALNKKLEYFQNLTSQLQTENSELKDDLQQANESKDSIQEKFEQQQLKQDEQTKEKQTDNSNCDIEKQDQKYYQDKISRLQIESQQTKQFLSLSEENIRNLNAEIKILKDQDQELQQQQFNNLCGELNKKLEQFQNLTSQLQTENSELKDDLQQANESKDSIQEKFDRLQIESQLPKQEFNKSCEENNQGLENLRNLIIQLQNENIELKNDLQQAKESKDSNIQENFEQQQLKQDESQQIKNNSLLNINDSLQQSEKSQQFQNIDELVEQEKLTNEYFYSENSETSIKEMLVYKPNSINQINKAQFQQNNQQQQQQFKSNNHQQLQQNVDQYNSKKKQQFTNYQSKINQQIELNGWILSISGHPQNQKTINILLSEKHQHDITDKIKYRCNYCSPQNVQQLYSAYNHLRTEKFHKTQWKEAKKELIQTEIISDMENNLLEYSFNLKKINKFETLLILKNDFYLKILKKECFKCKKIFQYQSKTHKCDDGKINEQKSDYFNNQ